MAAPLKNAWKGTSAAALVFGALALLAVSLAPPSPAAAGEFRSGNRIYTPNRGPAKAAAGVQVTDPKDLPGLKLTAVPRADVERIVRGILKKWNTPGMAATLSDDFRDKERLLDGIQDNIPRDARLELVSLRGVRTLRQRVERLKEPGTDAVVVISEVSALADTRLISRNAGGTSTTESKLEFILDVRQRYSR